MDSTVARASQRVTRRCTFCTRRKIRCDMQLPCLQCRSRGRADSCQIEPVIVKGRLVRNAEEETQPSYAEVVAENTRYRAALQLQSSNEGGSSHVYTPSSSDPPASHLHALAGGSEQQLYDRLKAHYRTSSVHAVHDIIFPSDACSTALLEYGESWVGWLHCAVDGVQFFAEHRDYLEAQKHTSQDTAAKPQWLALYFASLTASLLFLPDELAAEIGVLRNTSVKSVLLNWFDASLFFLYRADFMRYPDVRCIQAIAVLGISFPNLAEFNLYYHLWSSAFRSAQLLRINIDAGHTDETPGQRFIRRCLFWSLVIDDWLAANLGYTCLDELDFSVEQPADLSHDPGYGFVSNRESSGPRPLQLFLSTIKICCALRRFYKSLLTNGASSHGLEEMVKQADNDLAQIISGLPDELQPPSSDAAWDADNVNEADNLSLSPQLLWQRRSICIALFYYRIVVYRLVRTKSAVNSVTHGAATSVCLSSAHGIVDIMTQLDEEGDDAWSRQSVWLRLLPLFSATAILLECGHNGCCQSEDVHRDCVDQSITFFRRLEVRSIYAAYAASVLEELRQLHS